MTSDHLSVTLAIGSNILLLGTIAASTDRFPLGRLNRRWFFVTFFGGAMIGGLAAWGLEVIAASQFHPAIAWALAVPLMLVMFLGIAALMVSPLLRIHDLGLVGMYYYVALIPFVNLLFMVGIFLWPGAKEPNRYGVRNRYLQRHPVENVTAIAV